MRKARYRISAAILSLSLAVAGLSGLAAFAQPDADLPQGASGLTISEFEALETIQVPLGTSLEDVEEQLPAELTATMGGAEAAIPVEEWAEADPDDNPYNPDVEGFYTFLPAIGDQYILAADVELPEQVVQVGDMDGFVQVLNAHSAYRASDAGAPRLISPRSFYGAGSHNYRDQLSAQEKEVYDEYKLALVDASTISTAPDTWIPATLSTPLSLTTTVSIPAGATFYDLMDLMDSSLTANSELQFLRLAQGVVDALLYDCPEIFYLKMLTPGSDPDDVYTGFGFNSAQVTRTGTNTIQVSGIGLLPVIDTSIYPDVNDERFQIRSALADIEVNYVDHATGTVEKVRAMHDRINDIITYNEEVKQNQDPPTSRVYQLSGALLDGDAVCEGYAKALKILCDRAGIPCVLVVGQGYGRGTSNSPEAHMWNYVQIGGKWYAVDATWDDDNPDPYMYFLVGSNTLDGRTERFNQTHVASGDFSGTGIISFNYPALQTQAYDPNGLDDENITDYITITPASPNGANGWYTSDITIAAKPGAPNGFNQLYVDGMPQSGAVTLSTETPGASVTINMGDGSNFTGDYVFVYKLDKSAPNVPTTAFTQTINTVEGVLRVSNVSDNGPSGVATITVTCPDGSTLVRTADGSAAYDFAVVQNGAHVVTVTDNAGHTSTATETVNILTINDPEIQDSAGQPYTGGTYDAGDTVQLKAFATSPNGAVEGTHYSFAWSSSNDAVATVSATGLVTVHSYGQANIILTAQGRQASVRVAGRVSTSPNTDPNPTTPTVQIPDDGLPEGVNLADLRLVVTGIDGTSLLADSQINSLLTAFGADATLTLEISLRDIVNNVAINPPEGVVYTVNLPYPAGSDSSKIFQILHRKSDGTVENITSYSKTATGLQFSVSSFSEFVVSFKDAASTPGTGYRPGSGGSGSSGGGSSRQDTDRTTAAESFWNSINRQILNAKSGSTIHAKIGSNSDRVPARILENLKGLNITLVLEWPDGRTVSINGMDIGVLDQDEYIYKELSALYGAASTTDIGIDLSNPTTGGDGDYIVISAPAAAAAAAEIAQSATPDATTPARASATTPEAAAPSANPSEPATVQAAADIVERDSVSTGAMIIALIATLACLGIGSFAYYRRSKNALK